jgi:D-aminopeptidase
MRTIFVPGAVVSGDDINLPDSSPPISSITSVQIIRTRDSFSLNNLNLATQIAVGGAVTNALGHDASSPPQLETAAGSNVTIEGVVEPSATPSSGADPIVSAIATLVDNSTFTLDTDTEDGDLLEVNYLEVGQFLKTS